MVYHVLSDSRLEPFGGLDAGVPGQLFDLVETESLDNPVAKTGPSQIMECSLTNACQRPYLVKVVADW